MSEQLPNGSDLRAAGVPICFWRASSLRCAVRASSRLAAVFFAAAIWRSASATWAATDHWVIRHPMTFNCALIEGPKRSRTPEPSIPGRGRCSRNDTDISSLGCSFEPRKPSSKKLRTVLNASDDLFAEYSRTSQRVTSPRNGWGRRQLLSSRCSCSSGISAGTLLTRAPTNAISAAFMAHRAKRYAGGLAAIARPGDRAQSRCPS